MSFRKPTISNSLKKNDWHNIQFQKINSNSTSHSHQSNLFDASKINKIRPQQTFNSLDCKWSRCKSLLDSILSTEDDADQEKSPSKQLKARAKKKRPCNNQKTSYTSSTIKFKENQEQPIKEAALYTQEVTTPPSQTLSFKDQVAAEESSRISQRTFNFDDLSACECQPLSLKLPRNKEESQTEETKQIEREKNGEAKVANAPSNEFDEEEYEDFHKSCLHFDQMPSGESYFKKHCASLYQLKQIANNLDKLAVASRDADLGQIVTALNSVSKGLMEERLEIAQKLYHQLSQLARENASLKKNTEEVRTRHKQELQALRDGHMAECESLRITASQAERNATAAAAEATVLRAQLDEVRVEQQTLTRNLFELETATNEEKRKQSDELRERLAASTLAREFARDRVKQLELELAQTRSDLENVRVRERRREHVAASEAGEMGATSSAGEVREAKKAGRETVSQLAGVESQTTSFEAHDFLFKSNLRDLDSRISRLQHIIKSAATQSESAH